MISPVLPDPKLKTVGIVSLSILLEQPEILVVLDHAAAVGKDSPAFGRLAEHLGGVKEGLSPFVGDDSPVSAFAEGVVEGEAVAVERAEEALAVFHPDCTRIAVVEQRAGAVGGPGEQSSRFQDAAHLLPPGAPGFFAEMRPDGYGKNEVEGFAFESQGRLEGALVEIHAGKVVGGPFRGVAEGIAAETTGIGECEGKRVDDPTRRASEIEDLPVVADRATDLLQLGHDHIVVEKVPAIHLLPDHGVDVPGRREAEQAGLRTNFFGCQKGSEAKDLPHATGFIGNFDAFLPFGMFRHPFCDEIPGVLRKASPQDFGDRRAGGSVRPRFRREIPAEEIFKRRFGNVGCGGPGRGSAFSEWVPIHVGPIFHSQLVLAIPFSLRFNPGAL